MPIEPFQGHGPLGEKGRQKLNGLVDGHNKVEKLTGDVLQTPVDGLQAPAVWH